jgi:flagellar biosynthesis/type III secretory pathway protein FliH
MEVEAAFLTTRTEWEKQAHAALEQAKAELQRSHVRLNGAADALAEALLEDRRWAESTAIELAYAALSRVLGDKAADHSLVVELCTQAQRECTGDVVSVRVAPADAEPLRRALPRLDVIADDGLLPGSCVLESHRGRFDAGLEGRLDQVRAALLAALYQEKPAA